MLPDRISLNGSAPNKRKPTLAERDREATRARVEADRPRSKPVPFGCSGGVDEGATKGQIHARTMGTFRSHRRRIDQDS